MDTGFLFSVLFFSISASKQIPSSEIISAIALYQTTVFICRDSFVYMMELITPVAGLGAVTTPVTIHTASGSANVFTALNV